MVCQSLGSGDRQRLLQGQGGRLSAAHAPAALPDEGFSSCLNSAGPAGPACSEGRGGPGWGGELHLAKRTEGGKVAVGACRPRL